MDIVDFIVTWLVDFVERFGYVSIFAMTFVESSFVPIPSEVTMIPAGYLVQQGKMNFFWVMVSSIIGTIGGAWFNYVVAMSYGRRFIERFGKYFFLPPKKLEKIEHFFLSHGAITTFTGRLIPGIRHYISLPAGLARMPQGKFLLYTGIGGSIWMFILVMVGYFIGANKEAVKTVMPLLKVGMILAVAVMIFLYAYKNRTQAEKNL